MSYSDLTERKVTLMTVKEVEQLTGMTRANIRYYEMEGLMLPKRNANGHREYSESDVEELNKIKLLRMLYISIEEIKELKSEEKELSEVLELQLTKLKMEKESVSQAMNICRMMQSDNVEFKSLNAGYYFEELNKMVQGENEVLKKDQVPAVIIPIRRFLARALDYSIYMILWNAFMMLVCGKDLAATGIWGTLANAVMIFVIMILCESILLSCFGTTLGKCVLGIKVTNVDDGKLTFGEACGRCAGVIVSGYGLGIPVYEIYRQWKSYKTCKSGEPLSWEENSSIVLKDKKVWRNLVYALSFIVVVCIQTALPSYAELPDHRGEITVGEYSENYNQMKKYKGYIGGGTDLDENGKWEISEKYPEYYDSMEGEYPEITYYVEDGVMKGMNVSGNISSIYVQEIGFLVKAFVYAGEPESILTGEAENIYDYIAWSLADVEEKSFNIDTIDVYFKNNKGSFELDMKITE